MALDDSSEEGDTAVFPQRWSTEWGIDSTSTTGSLMISRVAASSLAASLLAATFVLGTSSPASAAGDAPDRCDQIVSASPLGSWISGTIESSTDVDWYRFPLPDNEVAQYLLGDLPADYQMQIVRHCGKARRIYSYRPGTEFEELILSTHSDPYMPSYVRVSSVSGASSAEAYKLRVRILPKKISILSQRSFADDGGLRHIVGEVIALSEFRRTRVSATLHDSSDVILGEVSARTMLRSLEGGRSPFELVFDPPPGFDHYRLSVSGVNEPVNPVARLFKRQLTPFVDDLSVGHFPGSVTNNNTFAIESLEVFVTLYDSIGRVINVAAAETSKDSMGPGGKALFDATFGDHYANWNRWRVVTQALRADSL